MKIDLRWTDVARASRPLSRGHPFAPLRAGSAHARERDAPATAGGTPALQFSGQKAGAVP